ncbi:acyltransferase family protein [Aquabacterium sp.]|uniref:acyltransferase family protein n=1 Tax=Aquabacterium sp. TaxID=1872578 RepID=UPI003B72126A
MTTTRVSYIDGLRGWAALSVMLFHVFWETFGAKFPEFRSHALAFFLNGHVAVFVFFILSGDALSHPFIQSGNIANIQKSAGYRYFRLTIPIILSCLITYILMKLGWTLNHQAAPIVDRPDWLGAFLPFEANFGDLIKYTTYAVYTNHSNGNSYNPFLWTMGIEMIGSLLVFAYLLVMKSSLDKVKPTIFVIIFFVLQRSYFCLFFVGVLLAQWRAIHGLQFTHMRKQKIIASVLLGAAFSYQLFTGHVGGGFNGRNILGAIFIVAAIYLHPSFQQAMSSRLSLWLGDISFPLYLVHFAAIISVAAPLAVWLDQQHALNFWTATAVGLCTSVISLVAAQLFMRTENMIQARVRPIVMRNLGLR